VRALLRARPPEKNAAREVDREKQNTRAAEPERSEAPEPDQRKQNPRAVVLNFRENLLLVKLGNLRPKQQVPVKELGKAQKRGLTGNKKGGKLTHLRPANRNKRIQSLA
jgi:hypothetical protein